MRTAQRLAFPLLLATSLAACSSGGSSASAPAAKTSPSPVASAATASAEGTPIPTFCKPDSPVVEAPGGSHRIISPAAIGSLRLQRPSAALTSAKVNFTKRFVGSGATLAAFEEYDAPMAKVFVAGVRHLPGEYYKARVNFLCAAASGVAVSTTPVAINSPGHADPLLCFDGPSDSTKAIEVCGWVDDTAVNVTVRAPSASAARALAVTMRAAVEKVA